MDFRVVRDGRVSSGTTRGSQELRDNRVRMARGMVHATHPPARPLVKESEPPAVPAWVSGARLLMDVRAAGDLETVAILLPD